MLSQRIKSHPKIFTVIFGSASYTLGIITSSGINTYFHYYDVSIEAASQAEVLKAEHRNNLIREIAEGNEAIMDAETKFLMASEFEAMRGALGLIAQASGNSPEAATADFVKTMERLGLSPKDAVFAESSNQYSNVKQKVIGTLASVDLYFSDEVSQYATEYRAYIRAPNIDEKRRMNYWAVTCHGNLPPI
ncbi:MAG: hypothetical protein JXQ84_00175 [Rhodospirillaceae bacterium]|nr:hypothetical protein [Rhodospirillaceae bacterium]